MKKLSSIVVMIMMGLTLALTGCRTEEDVKADVKPVVEKIMAQNGVIGGSCKNIFDIKKKDSNNYTAKAEIAAAGETAIVNLKITYKGKMVYVEVVK